MKDHITNTEYGRFKVNVCTEIVVNTELSWEIEFIPSKDIELGTNIKIIVPAYQHQRSEEYLQTYDYWKPNYIYAIGQDDSVFVDVQIEKVETKFKHIKKWLDSSRVAIIRLDKGLAKDKAIYIRFGGINRPWIDGIAPPSRISQFANRVEGNILDYQVYIGMGEDYTKIDVFPEIKIIPDIADRIILTSPSIVRENETFEIKGLITDKYLNPRHDNMLENLIIKITNLQTQDYQEIVYTNGLFKATIKNEGYYYVSIKNTKMKVDCSVILCHNNCPKIYWGDTHIHSNLTANIRDNDFKSTPRQAYLYANRVTNLDYICLSEQTFEFDNNNDLNIDMKTWGIMGDEADKYYKPGEFVTFTGFEMHDKRGDTVVLFRDSLSQYSYPLNVNSIQEVWEFYQDKVFLSIPHLHRYCNGRRSLDQQDITHGGFQLSNWEEDSKHEILCEIFSSQWGRFENEDHAMVLKARKNVKGNNLVGFLNQGKKWGVVANSDGHDGNPGYGGLTGVYAKEKTRESIFEGLSNRCTLATTHPRVIIDYNINNHGFGEIINDDTSLSRDINIRILSPVNIRDFQLIKNGSIYKHIEVNTKFVDEQIIDDNINKEDTYYYVRVNLEDGHMVWASPTWFIYK